MYWLQGREKVQRVLGITWNPAGLLWSLPLREHVLPASVNTYDTMHAVLSNGIEQNETGVLLDACRQAGIPFSRLQEFASAD